MKIMMIACLVLFGSPALLLSQWPADIGGPEFATDPELLAPRETRVEPSIRYIEDVVDYGAYHDRERDVDGNTGADQNTREAGIAIRWSASDNVELTARTAFRYHDSWGFNYEGGEFHHVVHVRAPDHEVVELSFGPRIRLAQGSGAMPDVTLATTVSVVTGLRQLDQSGVAVTARLQMNNSFEGAGEIRYSLGVVALGERRYTTVAQTGAPVAELDPRFIPSYSVAYLLPTGEGFRFGPEVVGEYRSEVGMRHWFGAGARIAISTATEIGLAGRMGSTLGKTRYQALVGVSMRL